MIPYLDLALSFFANNMLIRRGFTITTDWEQGFIVAHLFDTFRYHQDPPKRFETNLLKVPASSLRIVAQAK